MAFYANFKKKLELDLECMIDPAKRETNAAALKIIDDYFLKISQPKDFTHTKDNFIIMQEQNFEDLRCILEDNGATNVKEMTTFEFMKRSEYLERKFKTD